LIAFTTSTRAIFVLSWKTCRALDALKAPGSGISRKNQGVRVVPPVDRAQNARQLTAGVAPQFLFRSCDAGEASHRCAHPTNRS
jgi:hypothetical protein